MNSEPYILNQRYAKTFRLTEAFNGFPHPRAVRGSKYERRSSGGLLQGVRICDGMQARRGDIVVFSSLRVFE